MIDDVVITPRGKKLYVLTTQDIEGLEKREQIQVVKESRLMSLSPPLNEEISTPMSGGGGGVRIPFMGGGQTMPGNDGNLPSGNGNFVFAPVMVGGNMNTEPSQEFGGNYSNNNHAPPPSIPFNNMGGNRHMMREKSPLKSSETSSVEGGEKKPKSWLGGAIEKLGGFIVKKM